MDQSLAEGVILERLLGIRAVELGNLLKPLFGLFYALDEVFVGKTVKVDLGTARDKERNGKNKWNY